MECIICKDTGDEPLQDNALCKCNYKYHNSCWIDYVNSKETLQCLMCRAKIGTIPKTKSSLFKTPPSAPPAQPYTSSQHTYQNHIVVNQPQNSQLQDTIIPLMPQNNPPQPQPQRRIPFSEMTSAEKGKVILSAICIVAVIIVVIVLITTVW